jgi:hypothetical protein
MRRQSVRYDASALRTQLRLLPASASAIVVSSTTAAVAAGGSGGGHVSNNGGRRPASTVVIEGDTDGGQDELALAARHQAQAQEAQPLRQRTPLTTTQPVVVGQTRPQSPPQEQELLREAETGDVRAVAKAAEQGDGEEELMGDEDEQAREVQSRGGGGDGGGDNTEEEEEREMAEIMRDRYGFPYENAQEQQAIALRYAPLIDDQIREWKGAVHRTTRNARARTHTHGGAG